MMGCLVLYASCVGVLSSRKSAQAWARPLAFLASVGPARPGLCPLRAVRQRPLAALCDVVVAGLRIAGASGGVRRGQVSTDGRPRQGKASRHPAMSDGSMQHEVARIREEIEAWVPQASPQDAEDAAALGGRRGDAWPAALARREDRRAPIEAARQRLEARAHAAAAA